MRAAMVDITGAKFKMNHSPGFVVTPMAAKLLDLATIFDVSGQHYRLEQGQLCDEDHQENLAALENGNRFFTVHNVGTKTSPKPIWVITEAAQGADPLDRTQSITTAMDPSEY